jgi:hypothetical protein
MQLRLSNNRNFSYNYATYSVMTALLQVAGQHRLIGMTEFRCDFESDLPKNLRCFHPEVPLSICKGTCGSPMSGDGGRILGGMAYKVLVFGSVEAADVCIASIFLILNLFGAGFTEKLIFSCLMKRIYCNQARFGAK